MSARPQAVGDKQEDNARTRVTRWTFAPGAETGWHRHEYDYVIVPLADGDLLLEDGGGEKRAALAAGKSYFRRAGVEHNVVNANDFPFAFVEIELK
ncbi:MAG: cupin domain-containing protein [Betaproteobacteria bacterium]|nr:cupin domain-containing protein [Betaproteobacteria bacterium]